MAVGNSIYQYFSTREAFDFWGRTTSGLFVAESELTVARLTPVTKDAPATETTSGDHEQTLKIAGRTYFLGAAVVASTAGGNLHFRRALLQDGLFDWQASPRPVPTDGSITWHYAVTFADGTHRVTLVFSADAFDVLQLPGDSSANATPQYLKLLPNAAGISPVQEFLDEQLSGTAQGSSREF